METIYYKKKTEKKFRKSAFVVLLFFLVLLLIAIFVFRNYSNHSSVPNPAYSGNVSTINISPSSFPTNPLLSPTPFESKGLEQVVKNALLGSTGTYGIFIKNLQTGEYFSLFEGTRFQTASLYKLWVMAEAYEQIKNGILSDDEILSQDAKILNERYDIASESADLTEGTIVLSVNESLEKMITISDNYAALLLSDRIGLLSVSEFLKGNGLQQSAIGKTGGLPTATPHDIALFFEKTYNGQLVDKEYSDKMISLLKKQKLNSKIPKYLPDTTVIAHKTGELDEYTHDAGIIYSDNGDYVIAVLSKSDNPSLAAERIANVSEAVYQYFVIK